jgi:uncharacterized CHY-type Zn-finger protein
VGSSQTASVHGLALRQAVNFLDAVRYTPKAVEKYEKSYAIALESIKKRKKKNDKAPSGPHLVVCPECSRRMKINKPLGKNAWIVCPKCESELQYQNLVVFPIGWRE